MMMDTLFDLPPVSHCKVTLDNGLLVFTSPYDPGLVMALKAGIPSSDRKWDGARKAWLVTPSQATALKNVVSQYLHEDLVLPRMTAAAPQKETRLLEVHYIGQTKDRGSGDFSSFAYLASGNWDAIFPEATLREWFEAAQRPDEPQSLYAVLGLPKKAGSDDIKTAFRRLARQWHSDICKEPDAAEMFIKIKHASDILSNPGQRARYDAGLALEATLAKDKATNGAYGYRPPLRCGLVMADGCEVLFRFVVSKILAWEDITSQGKTLVSSWAMGVKAPTENWV
jgi:hypothetical protein